MGRGWAIVLMAWPLVASAAAQGISVGVDVHVGATTLLDQARLGTEARLEAFDAYGVAKADLDGDGAPELLLMDDNARMYAIDVERGRVVAEVTTPHPGGTTWHTQTLNAVTVGDMDRDGRLDILVANTGGYVTRLERDPTLDQGNRIGLRTEWSVFAYGPAHDPQYWDKHPWITPTDPRTRTHLLHSAAILAPPAADAPEDWAFVQSDDLPGQFAFDAQGRLRWMVAEQDGHAAPWVGELDGRVVALFATDAGEVVARQADTGALLWTQKVDRKVASPGSHSVAPVVADLDGDGDKEVFVAARVAVQADGDWMHRQHAYLQLLDDDGHVLWSVQHPKGNPNVHSRALAVDASGDGRLDILVLDWNSIGHKPGDFERLGPGRLFALDGANGKVLWTADVDAPETDFDVATASLGGSDVGVVPDAKAGRAGVSAIRLTDGAKVAWSPLPTGWNVTRGATVIGSDATGLEVAVALDRPGTGCVPKWDEGCREGAFALVALAAPPAPVPSANERAAQPIAPAAATEKAATTRAAPGPAPALATLGLLGAATAWARTRRR